MSSANEVLEHYRMGKLTAERSLDGWIVCEDGAQVGGTLIEPFDSKADAERWIGREMAGYQEDLAAGNVRSIAKAKVIRGTDPDLWARCAEIEAANKGVDDNQRHAAHRAAGQYGLMLKFARVGLEADGLIVRTGEMLMGPDGLEPVFCLADFARQTIDEHGPAVFAFKWKN